VIAPAPAKINLALVVGPTRDDGLHEVATILQRVELHDTISLEPCAELTVEGYEDDTIVRWALEAVAAAAGVEPAWRARIEKRIPVAAGLGGGSSDAATAMRLAAELIDDPLPKGELQAIARSMGVDVAFFLEPGPQLGLGDGTTLRSLALPQDFTVLLVLPHGESKQSTREVYLRFDGEAGFDERRARVTGIAAGGSAASLAALPPNDLASSPLSLRLHDLGAFRADVSGAGPVVYGLFADRTTAELAEAAVAALGETWLTRPAW
jgi:4-diphosphocytidyl-2-C-methyl-D-erythritol kinase